MSAKGSIISEHRYEDMDKKVPGFGIRDFIFLACIFLGLLLVFLSQRKIAKPGKYVLVTVSGQEYTKVPLVNAVSLTIDIEKDGVVTNILHVENGAAFITDAECPDKLCVKQGKISRLNETIVCLPNEVVVTVTGEETQDRDIDAVSGR